MPSGPSGQSTLRDGGVRMIRSKVTCTFTDDEARFLRMIVDGARSYFKTPPESERCARLLEEVEHALGECGCGKEAPLRRVHGEKADA